MAIVNRNMRIGRNFTWQWNFTWNVSKQNYPGTNCTIVNRSKAHDFFSGWISQFPGCFSGWVRNDSRYQSSHSRLVLLYLKHLALNLLISSSSEVTIPYFFFFNNFFFHIISIFSCTLVSLCSWDKIRQTSYRRFVN